MLDVANNVLSLIALHTGADDSAGKQKILARIRQRGTPDALTNPAGSSGDLRNILRLVRADCFYKLHRALDGAGACISVVFAIQ